MADGEQPWLIGWLRTAERPDEAWPGVVLHRDALLVRAPRGVLAKPAVDLQVVIESDHGLGPRVLIAEVRLLEVDGEVDDPATAMLRLESGSGVDVSATINRSGFDIAVRVTGDVWKALVSLGLVPELLDRRPPPPALLGVSHSPSISTVPVQDQGWCDIFWWLC